ncbi:MAG: glycine--tRNA ligase subunit beta [Tissierellia bacterium]|nr:glycine--tRNA ligase subunit beta [Tissierellia bacterium]
MNKYLLEIGVEELPARYVDFGLNQLREKISEGLDEHNIRYGNIRTLATPRRLTIIIEDIAETEKDEKLEIKGPTVKISYDADGNPTKPLLGFMKSQGITEEDLEIKEVKGNEYIFGNIFKKGRSTKEYIQEEIGDLIRKVHFPKNMRWGGKNIRFARPIRWVMSIWNNEVIPFDFEGIPVGNVTRGHRFLGSSTITLSDVDSYEKVLEENYVIVDQVKRKEKIKYESARMAKSLGGEIKDDPDLLDELTYIVEYPTPIVGNIKEEYLNLPPDVITTPMREHLRYIPIYNSTGNLMPYFITIRNGNDEYADIVAEGNEKVLGARLEDAKFFFEEDLKVSLEERVDALKGIIFQEQLGTLKDKTKRIRELVEKVGLVLEVAEETVEAVDRAAFLSKSDLTTNMVQEFTELQGEMGEVYALKSGEEKIVAQAIREQYLPAYADDDLPESTTGTILSLSDKLDSITGLFAIGLKPTGSQDPFALRRAAIGIIHMINKHKWDLPLDTILDYSLYIYVQQKGLAFNYTEVKNNILEFFMARIKQMLLDENIPYDIVDAILATKTYDILELFEKSEGVRRWLAEHDTKDFIDGYTRLANLAVKYEDGMKLKDELLKEKDEIDLYHKFNKITLELDQKINQKEFIEALDLFNTLTPLIHNFFDHVMVLTEDVNLRNTRLALLHMIDLKMKRIMDINKLVQND